MKAIDLSNEYVKKGSNIEALTHVVYLLIKESIDLIDKRHVESDDSVVSILRELDDKFRAFARMHNNINRESFKIGLHSISPVTKMIFP